MLSSEPPVFQRAVLRLAIVMTAASTGGGCHHDGTKPAAPRPGPSASLAPRGNGSAMPRPGDDDPAEAKHEGAASSRDGSPGDGPKDDDVAWVCSCEVERHNAEIRSAQTLDESQFCSNDFVREGTEVLAGCLAAYRGDCRKYLACERGDEDFPPRCDPGDVAIFSRCYPGCRSDGDCDNGYRCTDAFEGIMACVGT